MMMVIIITKNYLNLVAQRPQSLRRGTVAVVGQWDVGDRQLLAHQTELVDGISNCLLLVVEDDDEGF